VGYRFALFFQKGSLTHLGTDVAVDRSVGRESFYQGREIGGGGRRKCQGVTACDEICKLVNDFLKLGRICQSCNAELENLAIVVGILAIFLAQSWIADNEGGKRGVICNYPVRWFASTSPNQTKHSWFLNKTIDERNKRSKRIERNIV